MAAEPHGELKQCIEVLNRLSRELRAALAKVPPAVLYTQPASGGWTPMEDLAHVAEMLGYWSGEIDRFQRQPGASFGRVATNPERLRFIETHAYDTLEQITTLLDQNQATALDLLRRLRPADLEITGQHVKFGAQTVRQALQQWLIEHLAEHVAQFKAVAASVTG